MWGVVTALAAAIPFGVTLAGDDAFRVMADAWGSAQPFPGQLGRKWAGRFAPSY